MPTIAAFMRTYPEISLNLDFTDPLVDVIEEGFDSIVRTGEVRDYATYEPEPRTSRQKVVASPDNSKKKARQVPEDRLNLRCLHHRYANIGDWKDWIRFIQVLFVKGSERYHHLC